MDGADRSTRPILACLLVLVALAGCLARAEGSSEDPHTEATRTFKRFIESPPVVRSLRARVEMRAISFMLTANDITNLPSLALKLRSPPPSDRVSQYIRTNLSRLTRGMLSNFDGTQADDARLRHEIARDLNRIIYSGPIFESNRFEGLRLSPTTSELLTRNAVGQDLLRLNRLLLLDAYAGEIDGLNHPAAREVYVELRWQTNAFYIKTASTLAGLDEPFVRPVGLQARIDGATPVDSLAAGWYETNLWAIANGVFQTDGLSGCALEAYARSNRNPIIVELPLRLASKIMNLGVPSEKLASLRWSRNHVRGTEFFGNEFEADLEEDGSGRPSRLRIVYPSWSARPGSNLPREEQVTYGYQRAVAGWKLPSEICMDGTNCLVEILSAQIGGERMGQKRFDYRPFLNRRSGLMLISVRIDQREVRRVRYDDVTHGLRRLGGFWLTKNQVRLGIFLALCVMTASIVTVAIAIEKKRKQRETVLNYETKES